MNIKDIVNDNFEQFKYGFWLDLENKMKYIDLFKRGITSGDTLGLFFIKDAKAILELVRYYKDFKKIIIYDCDGPISLLKDYDSIDEFNDPRVEYVYVGQDLPMKFDKIIMNPPYNLGNKITEAVLSSLNEEGDCVCLQPLSQYKRKDLYRYVDSFELADPSLFEDAVITENLSICTLKKEYADKYTWQDLVLRSVDQKYIEYYRWNINNNKGLVMTQMSYKKPEDLNIYTDFWETCKCFSSLGGGGFGSNGGGYRWNVLYDNSAVNAGIGCIHFNTKLAKDNFCKWWYFGKKGEKLASKAALGVHMGGSVGPNTRFAIPQIDWENISNSPLWKAGNYDDAVLSEMGLKWNADKTVIIKDE